MSSAWSPNLHRGSSTLTDFGEVDRGRTRRLAAKLFRGARPVLGIEPRRQNAYIALDAVAWVAARLLAGIEDRDAYDFFALALTRSLAQLEASETVADFHSPPVGASATEHPDDGITQGSAEAAGSSCPLVAEPSPGRRTS